MTEFGIGKIIAAVRTGEEFSAALDSGVECIFLLSSNILTVGEQLSRAHAKNKKVFIHLDMSEGIGRDSAGVEFLARLGVDGIISTRTAIIRAAHEHSLPSVQRVFAIDSQATKTSTGAVGNFRPTFIEIMPGVIPKVIKRFSQQSTVPVIAGGLVETADEVKCALESGAVAVSTANKTLW